MAKRTKQGNQRSDTHASERRNGAAGRAKWGLHDQLPDIKRILIDFMAAHQDGMTALQKRDYAKLGEAIDREQDLIAEQRSLIERQRRDMRRMIREISDSLAGHRHTTKRTKR